MPQISSLVFNRGFAHWSHEELDKTSPYCSSCPAITRAGTTASNGTWKGESASSLDLHDRAFTSVGDPLRVWSHPRGVADRGDECDNVGWLWPVARRTDPRPAGWTLMPHSHCTSINQQAGLGSGPFKLVIAGTVDRFPGRWRSVKERSRQYLFP